MASQPITIAVTGGIGSGKTTVARNIHKGYDANVFFADTEAKDLLTSSSNIQLALRDAFGDYIFDNEFIDTEALTILDFTETNPFGEPADST